MAGHVFGYWEHIAPKSYGLVHDSVGYERSSKTQA